jgi:shikimate kinase
VNIILFGFKSCGKTYFGKLLAKELERSFVDTDDLIVEECGGVPIRVIYLTVGEVGFRALEKKVVEGLKSNMNAVIALGGGAVLDPENVTHLKKVGEMIYLEASFDTIRSRIQEPPAFANGSLQQVYKERKPIYESIGARKINVDVLDKAGVLAALRSVIYLEDRPNGF